MSARKFPSFVNPNPSNSRSSRGKIPASGFEGRNMLLMQRREGSSFCQFCASQAYL